MDETKQIKLSDVNTILEVLQSVVSKSFMSTSRSQSQEERHLAANVFPVITCFASVLKFVNEGSVNIPQVLVKEFLEVATILNIVKEEDVHQEDPNYYVDCENLDPDEEIHDNLWWDDNTQQYQLYWGDDDADEVFSAEESEEESDDNDFSVADRVKARRARLGATAAAEVRYTPPPCSPPPTSPPPTPSRRTEIKRDPFITALLRTISRTAPKAVFSSKRSEILKKERSDIKIADIVPEEFRKLWDTHDEEEEVKIITPDPYPTIDWSKVNKRFIDNIPKPSRFPIHSCSPDPAFYAWTEKKDPENKIVKVPSPFEKYDFYRKKGWFEAAKGGYVFGGEFGYDTSEGIVSMDNVVHHGYVWSNYGWILHAQKANSAEETSKKKYKNESNNNFNKRKFRGKEKPH